MYLLMGGLHYNPKKKNPKFLQHTNNFFFFLNKSAYLNYYYE